MHARTFVVLAAAAVALAAYAGWIALRPAPPRPLAEPAQQSESTTPTPAQSTRRPKTPEPKPKPKPEPEPEPEFVPEPVPEPERPPKQAPDSEPPRQPDLTPFDRARELYDQAANTLRSDRALTEAGTKALLEQAKLAIKDMDALAEPNDERHKRDLHRATEDLARLQARYR